jgi:hypothetical protein
MLTKYILGALAVVFLALAFSRIAGGRPKAYPQVRTWLLIGVIFAVVSAWLFFQQGL